MVSKKQAIAIGIALIVGIVLIISFSGVLDNPHVHDVKVHKSGKTYKIDFECDTPHDSVLVALSKDGETIYTSRGTLSTRTEGNSVTIELARNSDIDEITFNVFDGDNFIEKNTIKDFKIIEE